MSSDISRRLHAYSKCLRACSICENASFRCPWRESRRRKCLAIVPWTFAGGWQPIRSSETPPADIRGPTAEGERPSALRSGRPLHRHRESRHPRQILEMRGGHILQLPRQHVIDGRPLHPRQLPQHLPLIPRHPRPQLHQPDRLRQHGRRVISKRLFDGRLLPQRSLS